MSNLRYCSLLNTVLNEDINRIYVLSYAWLKSYNKTIRFENVYSTLIIYVNPGKLFCLFFSLTDGRNEWIKLTEQPNFVGISQIKVARLSTCIFFFQWIEKIETTSLVLKRLFCQFDSFSHQKDQKLTTDFLGNNSKCWVSRCWLFLQVYLRYFSALTFKRKE